MRLTSEIFVAALVRRVFGDGGFATVGRRGAEAAGAIFVVARSRSGEFQLFGPAPQTLAAEGGERRFVREAARDEDGLSQRLAREARFDPDFWVVEIETETPETYLEVVEPEGDDP
ncbi:DUF1491 family protein [Aureimonas sp. AU20]|uniref:DUF1491 family protein n=1 Tax=Aureimonas sp. AU20 TaxID=1349819 RepID=UPI000720376E|nr:DUF1491 family protein [Aureimonas sp. AU20]ALN73983.1 hypothetical protein M673_14745 [Aureimonas sp. AU20]